MWILLLPKNLVIIFTNWLSFLIQSWNQTSFLDTRSKNKFSFIFASDRLVNFLQRYLKHCPSLGSLMCRGGSRTFSRYMFLPLVALLETVTWHHLYFVFTNICPLLIDIDLSECWNISSFSMCSFIVSFNQRSLHFSARGISFIPIFKCGGNYS